jgi:hypothetical protein
MIIKKFIPMPIQINRDSSYFLICYLTKYALLMLGIAGQPTLFPPAQKNVFKHMRFCNQSLEYNK